MWPQNIQRKKLTKQQGKKDKATIITSVIKKQTKHKTKQSKDIEELNNTINNLDIMEIDVPLCPTTAECILFLIVYRIFTKIEHTLGHKQSVNKFQMMFSHHFSFHK